MHKKKSKENIKRETAVQERINKLLALKNFVISKRAYHINHCLCCEIR